MTDEEWDKALREAFWKGMRDGARDSVEDMRDALFAGLWAAAGAALVLLVGTWWIVVWPLT